MLANPSNPKSEVYTPSNLKTSSVKPEDFAEFDYRSLPRDGFFISIVSSRRAGKSTIIEHLINQFQRDKNLRFSHIFLISPTGYGFRGIPPPYRYRRTSALDYILSNQEKIRDHNKQARKEKQLIKSRILIVMDDCACMEGKNDGLKNDKISSLALNGRHYSTGDPMKGNGVSVILISQALKKIPRSVRLNQDAYMCNYLIDYNERKDVLDSCFYIDSSPHGKAHGRKVYETLSQYQPFQFVVIENHVQNKKGLSDYVKRYRATPPCPPFRYFGNKRDWEGVEPFDN